MTTPRVFLIEPTTRDVSPAQEFGEIVEAFADGKRRPSIMDASFGPELLKRLAELNYMPYRDRLLIAGPTATLAVAVSAVIRAWPSYPVLVLLWSTERKRYVERSF